jgi:phosphoglycerol geranylgeranyltransferase
MKFVYLEAGSGSPLPVPNEMIRAVKKEISVPLIVGGGIKNASIAKEKIEAGADIIVTGNIIERDVNRLKEIISVIKPMK